MNTVVRWTGESNDPYASLIESFIGREFPGLKTGNCETVMEALVELFLGTKQTRIGPKPNPESVVKMRDVVRRAVHEQRPIPVLIAVASVKVPFGHGIDLAELSAMRVLSRLQFCAQQYYSPGFQFRLRIEDLTELMLSGTADDVRQSISSYRENFMRLIRVLGYDFIVPVPESSMVEEAQLLDVARVYARQFFNDLVIADAVNDDGKNVALNIGWEGGIPKHVREYYCSRYSALYPDRDHSDHLRMMADYFGTILARHKLGVIGNDKSFQGRLEIGFNEPPPNAPAISTRVFYRSVPANQSSNNRPYWYAKGYLKIDNNNHSRICFGRWEELDYHQGRLSLSNGNEEITLDADYILE